MTADTILDDGFAALSVVAACALTGRSRATHYRRVSPPARAVALIPHAERQKPPSTLSETERAVVLETINRPSYADLSICQIWARELDEDRYLCSMSTMYRIARAAGQVRERRALATHPAKKIPELLATGPSEVWTWDITKLRGPVKGVWHHLYALIDIYSRYSPGWLVMAAEDSVVARDFIDDAIDRNGVRPHTIHADRGTSMTSKTVAVLLVDLGITRSHSRPRVSNDNPYSEAQFKTLKYVPDFPHHFDSLAHARTFCDEFFTDYNHVHHHSGIGWHSRLRPPRYLRRYRRAPPADLEPRLDRAPRTLQPTTPTTTDQHRGLDQRTIQESDRRHTDHRNSLNSNCLT